MFLPLFLHPIQKHDSVAQLVEQYTFNVWVLGPSPSGITLNFLSRDKAFPKERLFWF